METKTIFAYDRYRNYFLKAVECEPYPNYPTVYVSLYHLDDNYNAKTISRTVIYQSMPSYSELFKYALRDTMYKDGFAWEKTDEQTFNFLLFGQYPNDIKQ